MYRETHKRYLRQRASVNTVVQNKFIHFLHRLDFPAALAKRCGSNSKSTLISEKCSPFLCLLAPLHGSVTHKHGQLVKRSAAISSKLCSLLPLSSHKLMRSDGKLLFFLLAVFTTFHYGFKK